MLRWKKEYDEDVKQPREPLLPASWVSQLSADEAPLRKLQAEILDVDRFKAKSRLQRLDITYLLHYCTTKLMSILKDGLNGLYGGRRCLGRQIPAKSLTSSKSSDRGHCCNHQTSKGPYQRQKAPGTELPSLLVDIMATSRPSRGLILRTKPSLFNILQAVKLYPPLV